MDTITYPATDIIADVVVANAEHMGALVVAREKLGFPKIGIDQEADVRFLEGSAQAAYLGGIASPFWRRAIAGTTIDNARRRLMDVGDDMDKRDRLIKVIREAALGLV